MVISGAPRIEASQMPSNASGTHGTLIPISRIPMKEKEVLPKGSITVFGSLIRHR